MRENIGSIDVSMETSQDNVQVVQKRINLKEGTFQRNMLQMDLFFDDFPHILGKDFAQPFPGYIEFFLSPTPIILTTESLQLTPRRGPNAANDNILYKAIITTNQFDQTPPPLPLVPQVQRFPQDFLATNANFPFFHDQLYLTMVFHADDTANFPLNIRFSASLYMSYNEKKVKASRSVMGVISERFNMMIALNESNGRVLQNVANLAGDTIPAYQWGGIRPELMVSGATLSQYFLKRDGQEAEDMMSTQSLRTFAKFARNMVSNPEPFGTPKAGPVGNIPDWFRTMIPKGAVAGAVRDQFPPRVTQDNPALPGLGNILMV